MGLAKINKKIPFGFSLIEVLISLFLLSLLLWGFDAMEVTALRANRDAFYVTIAENQLNLMAERLRAQHATEALVIWNNQNQDLLPYGKGYLIDHSLTLFWGEKTTRKICKTLPLGRLKCLTLEI